MALTKPRLCYIEREDGSLQILMRLPQGDVNFCVIPKRRYVDRFRIKYAIDKYFSSEGGKKL